LGGAGNSSKGAKDGSKRSRPGGRPTPEQPRAGLGQVVSLLEQMGRLEFRTRKRLADLVFRELGVTFSVYADGRGIERIFPFDPIPRVIAAKDWDRLARGLTQRIQALNTFLADIYGEQRILAEGRVPADLVQRSRGYLPAVRGLAPPGGVYVHVAGIDLVRGPDGDFLVLEDNLRTPSGVSYVLENRMVMKRVYPQIFERAGVRSVDEYPVRLREALDSVAPHEIDRPRMVILSPGAHNSAYFEHCFLARRMGCELVQGDDLFVHDDRVFVRTTGACPSACDLPADR
jgi:uncharacterized circularly permuted ATP-grasp superfamily protein